MGWGRRTSADPRDRLEVPISPISNVVLRKCVENQNTQETLIKIVEPLVAQNLEKNTF
jgi:hypothetical protein